ncbi:amidase [Ralstonia phage RPSC1]|uniref:Lysozyme-like protein n=1 Tax=Ralstonia phage RPSC1 TaxID=2041351 RepID=A0A2Z2U7X2_9CAUD|nr:amidase [Ralstonia phage RPSC1]ATN92960.1 lysozyme-like protein [Ralstonia phage RPSC1]
MMTIPPALPMGPIKKRLKTDLIVVHCADTPPAMDVTARMINQWHTRDNGWAAIGYHFVIRRDGVVEGGRPHDTVGAHASQVNSRSVGICLAGGKGKPGSFADHFTDDQAIALVRLVTALQAVYPDTEVVGHRNVDNAGKTCPNFDAKGWWASTVHVSAPRKEA